MAAPPGGGAAGHRGAVLDELRLGLAAPPRRAGAGMSGVRNASWVDRLSVRAPRITTRGDVEPALVMGLGGGEYQDGMTERSSRAMGSRYVSGSETTSQKSVKSLVGFGVGYRFIGAIRAPGRNSNHLGDIVRFRSRVLPSVRRDAALLGLPSPRHHRPGRGRPGAAGWAHGASSSWSRGFHAARQRSASLIQRRDGSPTKRVGL